jgi:hypothetical protein
VPQRAGLNARKVDGDWRDAVKALNWPPVKLRTTLTEEHPRTILTLNQSPDIPFDQSINAYRGCDHLHRDGEQDGPNRMGGHDARRSLPAGARAQAGSLMDKQFC